MKTLVLGIGNPIVTDDSVGLKVARLIKDCRPGLDVVEACSGAMGLFDYVIDQDRVILIDSIKTENGVPGEVYRMRIDDLNPTLKQHSSHGLDIASAMKIGEGLGRQYVRRYFPPESKARIAETIRGLLCVSLSHGVKGATASLRVQGRALAFLLS